MKKTRNYETPVIEVTRFDLEAELMLDITVGGDDTSDPYDEGSAAAMPIRDQEMMSIFEGMSQ